MTNRDKINALSNIELAGFLGRDGTNCSLCIYRGKGCRDKSCAFGIKAWLGTPCEENPPADKDSSVNSRDNPLTAYRYVYDNGRIKCPNCSKEFVWGYYDGDGYDEINYCPYCGQRINVVDTEDDEEENHE